MFLNFCEVRLLQLTVSERERGRERDRDRDRERQRQRETERERERILPKITSLNPIMYLLGHKNPTSPMRFPVNFGLNMIYQSGKDSKSDAGYSMVRSRVADVKKNLSKFRRISLFKDIFSKGSCSFVLRCG